MGREGGRCAVLSACMRRGTMGTHPCIHTLIWARIHTFPVPRVMSSKPSVTSSKTEFLSVSPSRVCEALAEVTSEVIRGRHSSGAVRGQSEANQRPIRGQSEANHKQLEAIRGTIRVHQRPSEAIQRDHPSAHLLDRDKFDGVAEAQRASIRVLLALKHFHQGRLART